MSSLSFLRRRYEQIMSRPSPRWHDVPERQIRAWLTDDVCPFLHEFVRRPAFREQAAWPLRALAPVAGSAERRLVEEVDEALVACGKTFLRVSQLRAVHACLERRVPPRRVVTQEAVIVRGTGSRRSEIETGRSDVLPPLLGQTEAIADRYWADLVCVEDSFRPTGGWNSKVRGPGTAGVRPCPA